MTRLLQEGHSRWVERRPEATALVFRGQSTSYGRLEEESNRLAWLLRAAGCRRGDRVALLAPKSSVAIVAMLGVLKADAMYVPIDPATTAVRACRMLARADVRLVLAAGKTDRLLGAVVAEPGQPRELQVGWLDRDNSPTEAIRPVFTRGDLDACPTGSPGWSNRDTDPAHMLFTSGSTGEPKGVVVTHRSVVKFLDWAIGYFGIGPSDRNSGHPPLHFDLSTFDVFGTLTAGAQLHLIDSEQALLPHRLAAFIREAGLTQWFSAPSILNYMAGFDVVRDGDFPALRRVLWCGEVFPTRGLMYWMRRVPHATFTNLYGPTEATIASSFYTVLGRPASERAEIPIGTPCPGEELLVLDGEMRPLPPGVVGDLYIGGHGLSPGYWRDPERTAAAFVPYRSAGGVEERIYRTGDLARLGDDGLFYFHGRRDSQVKSRGYRIELGEIEQALNLLPSIREGAVVGVSTDGFEGTSICCAYVPSPGREATPPSLRRQLAAQLPAYMLPARWLCLDELPRNPNGKVDRRRLREAFEGGEEALTSPGEHSRPT